MIQLPRHGDVSVETKQKPRGPAPGHAPDGNNSRPGGGFCLWLGRQFVAPLTGGKSCQQGNGKSHSSAGQLF